MEILVVSVIALIVFGPQRLPEIARSLGRALSEFKRQASDIRSEFESSLEVDDEPERPGPIVHKGTTNDAPEPQATRTQAPRAPAPSEVQEPTEAKDSSETPAPSVAKEPDDPAAPLPPSTG